MTNGSAGARQGAGLSAHILPTSATMIGVCLTALYISLLDNVRGKVIKLDPVENVDIYAAHIKTIGSTLIALQEIVPIQPQT